MDQFTAGDLVLERHSIGLFLRQPRALGRQADNLFLAAAAGCHAAKMLDVGRDRRLKRIFARPQMHRDATLAQSVQGWPRERQQGA